MRALTVALVTNGDAMRCYNKVLFLFNVPRGGSALLSHRAVVYALAYSRDTNVSS